MANMKVERERAVFIVASVIAIGLLIWAYGNHPIGYYTLLRFVVCATCVYGAYYAMKSERVIWMCAMALVAILFNPIIPIYLKRYHWGVIDAFTAPFLLLSIPLLHRSQELKKESKDRDEKNNQRFEPYKSILWGLLLIIGACCFWYSIVGNPLNELALIRRGQIAPGHIVDTWEDVGEDDEGGDHWLHGATYTYRLPDGREFTQETLAGSGRLKEEFRNLEEPYPVEVEYLPDNPSVSRIKGDGSDTVTDWLWRKLGLGSLLLFMFLSPGITLLRNGVRSLKQLRSIAEIKLVS